MKVYLIYSTFRRKHDIDNKFSVSDEIYESFDDACAALAKEQDKYYRNLVLMENFDCSEDRDKDNRLSWFYIGKKGDNRVVEMWVECRETTPKKTTYKFDVTYTAGVVVEVKAESLEKAKELAKKKAEQNLSLTHGNETTTDVWVVDVIKRED